MKDQRNQMKIEVDINYIFSCVFFISIYSAIAFLGKTWQMFSATAVLLKCLWKQKWLEALNLQWPLLTGELIFYFSYHQPVINR